MSDRSWFYASQGQQQGPFPEEQFRSLIARGAVTPDTLVWTDGMAGWQRAGDIPGLTSGAAPHPPAFPQQGGPVAGDSGQYQYHAASQDGGALSVDFDILEFTWRSIAFFIGSCFIIPVPWLLVWYLKWLIPCVRVPGRPNLSFTGSAMTIVPWFFGFIVLAIVISLIGSRWLSDLMFLVQIALYWLFLKWFVASLASNGQPLGLSFSGSFWGYLGWTVLTILSFFTIVGWAWVAVAQIRWACRHIDGGRREIIFNGTGLEFLWRGIVTAIACSFIIPIPWMYRWFMQWAASQTALVERGMSSNV